MNDTVELIADKQHELAMALYNARYDNALYSQATGGKSNGYANALIDEALALCGSPYYRVSRRNWGPEAVGFLSQVGGGENEHSNSSECGNQG
jgi:hypothetical protein